MSATAARPRSGEEAAANRGVPRGPPPHPASREKVPAQGQRQARGAKRGAAAGDRESPRPISRTREADRGRRKADRRSGAATGWAEEELNQLLKAPIFRRIGWQI